MRAHCKSINEPNKYYGSDEIEIEIDHINQFKISQCPQKLLVGQQASFNVAGPNEQTPLSFGSNGLINFKWNIKDESIANIAPNFFKDDLHVLGFSVRIIGKKEGVTSLETIIQNIDPCICGESQKITIGFFLLFLFFLFQFFSIIGQDVQFLKFFQVKTEICHLAQY